MYVAAEGTRSVVGNLWSPVFLASPAPILTSLWQPYGPDRERIRQTLSTGLGRAFCDKVMTHRLKIEQNMRRPKKGHDVGQWAAGESRRAIDGFSLDIRPGLRRWHIMQHVQQPRLRLAAEPLGHWIRRCSYGDEIGLHN